MNRRLTTLQCKFWIALLCVSLAPNLAAAQKKKLSPTEPASCPYTEGDPELLAKAGIVSLGGFEFGKTDTVETAKLLSSAEIRWIETKHFEIGFALSRPYKVKQDEKAKIRAELEQLAEVWPEVKSRTKTLEPWIRGYLHARRLEQTYARFQEIMGVTDESFPEPMDKWNTRGKFMGIGPHLGQKGKYEILILPSEGLAVQFLRTQFGLQTRTTQRWNVIDRDSLIVVTHDRQSDLRQDAALHGHIAFNMTINLLDGFKHYSYETPIWLREGLGHFMEREINPRFNSFDRSEGAIEVLNPKWKWEPVARKMVRAENAPRLAQLLGIKSYGDMTFDQHVATWSMTEYLIKVHPEAYASIQDQIHGRMDKSGQVDASNLDDVHRQAFMDSLKMSYAAFDQAWAAWVLETYSSQ